MTEIPASIVWLSCEPLLEKVTLDDYVDYIDWVIVGGESGKDVRQFDLGWARSLLFECADAINQPALFIKQMGSNPWDAGEKMHFTGKGTDPNEWPQELRIQEFPC